MNKMSILSDSVQKQIHTLSISLASRASVDVIPTAAHPKELIEKELQAKIEEQIRGFFERFSEGTKEIMKSVIVYRQIDPDLDLGEIFTEFDKIGKGIALLGQQADDPRSLKEICGINEDTMAIFNSIVAWHYNNREYSKALKVYSFLCFLEPNQPAYWVGYGNCEFFDQRYDKAVLAYETALSLNGSDPTCMFYLAHCYHELHHSELAVKAVEQGMQLLKMSPLLKEQVDQAEQLKSFFNEMAVKL